MGEVEKKDGEGNVEGSLKEETTLIVPRTWADVGHAFVTRPKLASRILEALKAGVGGLYAPFSPWLKAIGKRGTELVKAKTKRDLAKIDLETATLKQRAAGFELERDVRRQQNREEIVSGAVELLMDENELSDDLSPMDEDWLHSFFLHCEDTSNEQMKTLWSKVLAREIVENGFFSRRTITFVKSLSEREAKLFTSFCSMVWLVDGGPVPIINHTDLPVPSPYDLITLSSIGLLNVTEGFGAHMFRPKTGNVKLSYFGEEYSAFFQDKKSSIATTAMLSPTGVELYFICGCEPDEDYKNQSISYIRSRGIKIESSHQTDV